MSKYDNYKPSDIAWIGDMPSEWKVNRIKNIVDIFGRIGFRGYTVADIVNDGEGAISLSPSNIIDQKIVLENSTYISFFKYDESPEIQIQNEDVILVKTASVGKAIYVEGLTEKTTINPQLIVFKNYKIHRKFFYYTVISNVIQGQITKDTAGGVIGTVTQQAINNYKIVIPSKTEQLTIANYLDDQTQKIDRLIANKKAQAEKLKELRQIEINNAVTKGINPNAEMKDSGIEWLGKIPKHWEVKRLKNVADINATKQELKYEEVKELEVVFLAMESVSENGQIDNSEKRPVSELWEGFTYFQKNDVIIAKITPCFENGKGAWLNYLDSEFGFGSTEFHTVRGHKNRLDNHYFYYVTKSDVFMQIGEAFMTGSAGQKRVSTNFILTFKLAFPPFEEQIEIAKYLQQRTAAIDQLIKNIEAQIEKLQELRKIKIYEAVTGKIKVEANVKATA